jgi:hypothetical protein
VKWNWINNKLTIKGPKESLMVFADAAKGFNRTYTSLEAEKRSLVALYQEVELPAKLELFCFHALFPVPQNVLQQDYMTKGYKWEMEYWGCCCGCANVKCTEPSPMANEWEMSYEFDTLDTVPVNLFDNIAPQYPDLIFVLNGKYQWKRHHRRRPKK